jgi:hypothetical protein
MQRGQKYACQWRCGERGRILQRNICHALYQSNIPELISFLTGILEVTHSHLKHYKPKVPELVEENETSLFRS